MNETEKIQEINTFSVTENTIENTRKSCKVCSKLTIMTLE